MARTRDEKSFQAKCRQILTAATQCFIESGFHGTGMAKICKAADMSAGTLYRYFPSKESIVEAIVEQDRTDILLFLGQIAQAENKAVGLSKAIATAAHLLAEDKTYCQLWVEISAEASRNPIAAEILAKSDAEVMAGFAAAVQQGQAAGQIDPTLVPDEVAQLLMVMVDGFLSQLAVKDAAKVEAIAQLAERTVFQLLSASA